VGVASAAIFLHSWKMASVTEITKEKKLSCSAFHAFRPRAPMKKGTRVMTFSSKNTRIGMKIFFSLVFRAV
jgi:hypothetical protein